MVGGEDGISKNWSGPKLSRDEAKMSSMELGAIKGNQRPFSFMDIVDYAIRVEDEAVAWLEASSLNVSQAETSIRVRRGATRAAALGPRADALVARAHEEMAKVFVLSEAFQDLAKPSESKESRELWRAARLRIPLLRTKARNVLGGISTRQRIRAVGRLKEMLAKHRGVGGMESKGHGVSDGQLLASATLYLHIVQRLQNMPLTQIMLKLIDREAPGLLHEDTFGRHAGHLQHLRSDVGAALYLYWFFKTSLIELGKDPIASETQRRIVVSTHGAILQNVERAFRLQIEGMEAEFRKDADEISKPSSRRLRLGSRGRQSGKNGDANEDE